MAGALTVTRVIVGVVALALMLVAPASASAVTFGADLSRTPTNTTACNQITFVAYDSCSTNFSNISTGESVIPPVGNGVVTAVRVRVGPVTGPMQVVVEQALRQDNPGDPGHPIYACCQAIRTSQVFTPAANAITKVNVNLPVRQDLAPDPQTGYYTDQHLSLSVLAPNVPIPAAADPNSGYSIFFPAWQAGDERCCPYGSIGAIVTMNADWQKCGGSGKSLAGASKKRRKKKSACGKRKKKRKKK